MSPRSAYVGAAVALVSLVAVVSFAAPTALAFPESDAFAHVAALKEWSSDLTSPGNSHLAVETPSLRYGPAFLVLASLNSLLDWGPQTLFALSAVLATVLLLVMLYLFARMWLPGEPWAPLAILFLLLFGWGLVVPWSGTFELRSLVAVAGYPSMWGFALALALAVAAARAAQAPSPQWLVATGLLSGGLALTHPIAALFGYSLAAVVAIDHGWRRFMAPGLSAIAGVVAALVAWPFYPLIRLFESHPALIESQRLPDPFYAPVDLLVGLFPVALGVYAISTLDRSRRVALGIGATAVAVPWLLNIFVPITLGHRFLPLVVFYLHLAIAEWGLPALRGLASSSTTRSVVRASIAVLIAAHLIVAIADIGGRRITVDGISNVPTSGEDSIRAQMRQVAGSVPNDAVVLADVTTQLMLPAFSGKVTALYREVWGVEDAAIRVDDAYRFFSANISVTDREALLVKYGASYVLFAPEEVGAAVTAELKAMGEVVVETRFFTLVSPAP